VSAALMYSVAVLSKEHSILLPGSGARRVAGRGGTAFRRSPRLNLFACLRACGDFCDAVQKRG